MAAKRIQGITNSTVFLYNVQYLLFLVEDDLISSINMTDHTENVLRSFQDNLTGDVFIGAAESMAMKFVGEIIRESRNQYPGIHYHINSGNAQDITDKLDRGLLDFGIIVEPVDFDKYNYLELPVKDTWGILMQKTSPCIFRSV